MKTLKHHQILFDNECPMCKLYTKAIVNAGILDDKGRVAYQEFAEGACPIVDRQRAVNEIALINHQTGEVTYGIHSLFKVMETAIPPLRFLFSFRPFVWLMSKVYAFVSYNRRVIIPAQTNSSRFQLQPTFKLGYRIAYLVFAVIIVGGILSAYSKLFTGLLPQRHAYREYAICLGQILFQGAVVLLIHRNKTWAYLGNMMTISLAGGLLLLPVIWLSHFFTIDPQIVALWFFSIVALMFLEHVRRTRLLNVTWWLTAGWVFYRIIILIFIKLEMI